jgi:SH3 domain protein
LALSAASAQQPASFRAHGAAVPHAVEKQLKADPVAQPSLVALDARDATSKRGRAVRRHLDGPASAHSQAEAGHPPSSSAQADDSKALRAELAALKESKSHADHAVEDLSAELQRLNGELIAIRQAAANALQIQAERDKLQESVINLERGLEAIKREKQALENDQRQDWFLIGAGVLSGGLILGLALPRISWRKRNHWDSF